MVGRFLSKTGNLKTRKVKKKKDRFGYGKTRERGGGGGKKRGERWILKQEKTTGENICKVRQTHTGNHH